MGRGAHGPLDRIARAVAASRFVRQIAGPEVGYVCDTLDSGRNEFFR